MVKKLKSSMLPRLLSRGGPLPEIQIATCCPTLRMDELTSHRWPRHYLIIVNPNPLLGTALQVFEDNLKPPLASGFP